MINCAITRATMKTVDVSACRDIKVSIDAVPSHDLLPFTTKLNNNHHNYFKTNNKLKTIKYH